MVVLDRFRLAEFEDAVKRGARLEPRVPRWSESSFDIRALRQMALDGPMAVDEGSQALIATSLSQAMVKTWAADIIYLPMAGGFLYLVAIMDWHSRYMMSWRLSNTLEAGFSVRALTDALGRGRPEVFNTDQGSQSTSLEFNL